MDYVFNGYHFQDRSEGRKSKFYVLGLKSYDEMDKLEKAITYAANLVTLENQLNKGKTTSYSIAPLYNKNKAIIGCAVYIPNALLGKMVE